MAPLLEYFDMICRVIELLLYSMVVLYSRDHGSLGFSDQKYHPKTSLTFPLQQFDSIG